MIDSNWIVPPLEIANESIGDVFYYADLVDGILTADIIIADDPIVFLLDIIAAAIGVIIVSGAASVYVSSVMRKRAEILLALINSGKPNF